MAELSPPREAYLPTPREGPSPFLEGTCIQFAVDSTSLTALKKCPRFYQLSIIEGWRPKADRVHLSFGIMYTKALEHYDQVQAQGIGHDDAVSEAVFNTMNASWVKEEDGTEHPWQYGPWDEKIGNKNRFTLIRSIIWYLDQYKDDPAKTVIDEDGNPLVERSFRMELDWGPATDIKWARHETIEVNGRMEQAMHYKDVRYVLCGHLDKVVNYLDGIYVLDHKTTKNAIGDFYFDQYNPHGQMTQYTLAGKVILRSPIKGVIIDAAQVLVSETRFARGFTYRTQAQLEEWLRDLKFWLNIAEDCATKQDWPMNDASCFNCDFNKGDSKICAKDPSVRKAFLESHFTQEDPWNPLKTRN